MKYAKILLFGLLITNFATAKTFSNQYIQFELPNGWECTLEGSEWVCQSDNQDRKREAIIILAAKVRGPQDSLEEYQAYLKQDKTYTLPGGKVQRSEPKYNKFSEVNGHRWLDALHLASEVPGFYTRYLATVKEDLGVAVTFSVAKDLYESYQGVFDQIIASMRVFRQAKTALDVGRKAGDNLGANFDDDKTFIPDQKVNIGAGKKGGAKDGEGSDDDLLIYGLIAAAVIFFIIKKKKKPAAKKKK